MGAEITLNGVSLGLATDQFLRYNFSIQGITFFLFLLSSRILLLE
jgi:hypothetical protein